MGVSIGGGMTARPARRSAVPADAQSAAQTVRGVMTIAVLPALALALTLLPGVRGVDAAPAVVSGPEAQLPGVTVTAPSPRRVPELVERFGRLYSGDRLARWVAPVCPYVAGLSADHDAFVAERIREIAAAVRVGAAALPCDPNLIVVISNQSLTLRRSIGRRADRLLNAGSRWPVDKNQLFAFTRDDGQPAHVFYLVDEGPTSGGGSEFGPENPATLGSSLSTSMFAPPTTLGFASSRLIPKVDNVFLRVFLVIDGARVTGFSLQKIAAYAAMTSLAEVRTDQPLQDVDTITAMFLDRPAARGSGPEDLTFWDIAYLSALYGAPSQVNLSLQRTAMAERIARRIQTFAVPAAASVDVRKAQSPPEGSQGRIHP